MHETIRNYLKALELEGRGSSVPGFAWTLKRYDEFLQSCGKSSPTHTTTSDLEAFQRHLAEDYRRPDNGKPLMRSTQATWLGTVKSFYAWMYRRGLIPLDPAKAIRIPRIVRRRVRADALEQQEAMAMVQTMARRVAERKEGTLPWAAEYRNLALLCMALATGRRRGSLRDLKVADLDYARKEVRVEWEKGQAGRVLPCCGWALDVAQAFVAKARPILLGGRDDPGWLFVSTKLERIRPDTSPRCCAPFRSAWPWSIPTWRNWRPSASPAIAHA